MLAAHPALQGARHRLVATSLDTHYIAAWVAHALAASTNPHAWTESKRESAPSATSRAQPMPIARRFTEASGRRNCRQRNASPWPGNRTLQSALCTSPADSPGTRRARHHRARRWPATKTAREMPHATPLHRGSSLALSPAPSSPGASHEQRERVRRPGCTRKRRAHGPGPRRHRQPRARNRASVDELHLEEREGAPTRSASAWSTRTTAACASEICRARTEGDLAQGVAPSKGARCSKSSPGSLTTRSRSRTSAAGSPSSAASPARKPTSAATRSRARSSRRARRRLSRRDQRFKKVRQNVRGLAHRHRHQPDEADRLPSPVPPSVIASSPTRRSHEPDFMPPRVPPSIRGGTYQGTITDQHKTERGHAYPLLVPQVLGGTGGLYLKRPPPPGYPPRKRPLARCFSGRDSEHSPSPRERQLSLDCSTPLRLQRAPSRASGRVRRSPATRDLELVSSKPRVTALQADAQLEKTRAIVHPQSERSQ